MPRTAAGFIDVDIDVEKKGLQALLFHLDTALNPVAIAGFLGATVDPFLRERASTRFAQEGDDVTGPWAPLKEATQGIRAQLGYGASHPINKRTGQLEDYITGSPNDLLVHPMGATLVLPGSPPTGELRSKVKTAQSGRTDPPRTVARPVLGMNEQDLAFVLLELAFYIGRGKP